MSQHEAEWAGRERVFRLSYGDVLDLEQATGSPIGEVFRRLQESRMKVDDVVQTIRLGLIGGGMDRMEAKRLVMSRLDTDGVFRMALLASEIIVSIMQGVEALEKGDDTQAAEPHKFSEVVQICRVFNLSPAELREMSFADVQNMFRGYNASLTDKVEPPSVEEFEAMLARDAERNTTNG